MTKQVFTAARRGGKGRMLQEEIRGLVTEAKDAEIAALKDTIDYQDCQLKEAQEAAARADAKAEELYAELAEVKKVYAAKLKKVRQQEQTIQTRENTIARQDDMIERMNVRLREKSAIALIQKMRDNIRDYETTFKVDYYMIDHLKTALDSYEREFS